MFGQNTVIQSKTMKPYVIINVAVSADGKMDTFERKGSSISSAQDKARVLRLRAEADAVMVGGHTLLSESPKLTVKTPELRAERIAKRRGRPGAGNGRNRGSPEGGGCREDAPGRRTTASRGVERRA